MIKNKKFREWAYTLGDLEIAREFLKELDKFAKGNSGQVTRTGDVGSMASRDIFCFFNWLTVGTLADSEDILDEEKEDENG